jgi:integrase
MYLLQIVDCHRGRKVMANLARRLQSLANERQTVRNGRKPNAKLRTREYLTEPEVERLIKAASRNRRGELRARRRLPASPFVFTSERSPFTRDGIAKFVARINSGS